MTDRAALIDAALADFGLFERIIEAIYTRIVRPGDTVVDGGACTGMHTLPLARLVGDVGRVEAFEPVGESADVLMRRLRHDGTLDRVAIRRAALGAAPGSADFAFVRNAPTRSGLREMPCPFPVEVERVTVPVVRMDDVVGGPVRFVKLDLEGGEHHALLGARRILSEHRPLVVLECGAATPAVYGYTVADFLALFAGVRYRLVDLFGDPITQDGWSRRRPWYAIAVPLGAEDERFVADGLPSIIDAAYVPTSR